MKTLIAAFAVLLAIEATATIIPAENHTFTIIAGKQGTLGHGCAVAGETITNAHVVDPRDSKDFSSPHKIRFRYEFPNGDVGRGYSHKISAEADLATVILDNEPSDGYASLGPKPQVGDKITWIEFDLRKRKNILKSRERKGKVVFVVAGHVLLDQDITQGASGGCAFDKNGHVVGLMTFGMNTRDYKTAAGITGLWGKWWHDITG